MKLETAQDERLRKTLEPAPVAGVEIDGEDRQAAIKLLNVSDLIDRIGIDGDSTISWRATRRRLPEKWPTR